MWTQNSDFTFYFTLSLRLVAILDLAEKEGQRGRKIWTIWFSCHLIPNEAISTPNSIWANKSHQLNFCDISASTNWEKIIIMMNSINTFKCSELVLFDTVSTFTSNHKVWFYSRSAVERCSYSPMESWCHWIGHHCNQDPTYNWWCIQCRIWK